jgi:hypothetical protein
VVAAITAAVAMAAVAVALVGSGGSGGGGGGGGTLCFGDTALMKASKSNFFNLTLNMAVQLVVVNRWPSMKSFHFNFLMEKPHFV